MPTGLEAHAVTFVPATNGFYVGAIDTPGMDLQGRKEKDYHKIATLHPEKLQKVYQGAKWIPGPKYDRIGAVEWKDNVMVRQALRANKMESPNDLQASVDETSLANITRVQLLTEIVNQQYKEVFLINGTTQIQVPKLKLDYDVQLHISTRGKNALVPKRQRGRVEAPEFIQTKFDLAAFGKLQRMIDTADEDELSALISPTQKAIDDITQVISQDENSLIKDTLADFTDKAKASWSALNAGNDFSLNNPLIHIADERKRITKNHGRVNTMVLNSVQWAKFVSNTNIKGYTEMFRQEQPGVMSFDKLPGITFIIDEDIADAFAYIYDRRALTYGVGPMVSESFRDPFSAVSGHVIRKWVEPKINATLASAFGSELTTI